MWTVRFLGIVLTLSLAVACGSPQQEPKAHNDPSRYSLAEDVLWASPGGFDLTMDVYTPVGDNGPYPVLMIFHGGGWLINDKSIMDQMAQYIATNGEYVVCNVDYRLLADQANTVTVDQIIGDVVGSVLWVKERISQYGGDPTQLAVTGDSAGAHLSAAVVNLGNRLSAEPYSEENLAFKPSYLPAAMTAQQVADSHGVKVQAALLSYGAFDLYGLGEGDFESWKNPFWYLGGVLPRGIFGDAYNAQTHPGLYKGVSPLHNVPLSSERLLPPQLLTVGTDDTLTTPAMVQAYLQKLRDAGQRAEYWEYQGKGHAFLDSRDSFAADAPPALDVMLNFLDRVFYPQTE